MEEGVGARERESRERGQRETQAPYASHVLLCIYTHTERQREKERHTDRERERERERDGCRRLDSSGSISGRHAHLGDYSGEESTKARSTVIVSVCFWCTHTTHTNLWNVFGGDGGRGKGNNRERQPGRLRYPEHGNAVPDYVALSSARR